MTNFIIMFICFFLGFFLKNLEKFPRSTAQALNLIVIYVALPALILVKLPKLLGTLELVGNWWVPISMAWLTFFIATGLVLLIAKKYHWSKAKTGALILCTGLGNTSFVGFPILEAVIGREALPIGILADQPGSFFMVSSLGIMIAAMYAGEKADTSYIVKRIFTFPPFMTMILAVIWYLLKLPFAAVLNEPLDKISQILVPLSLFAVGFQTDFKFSIIKKRAFPLAIGLFIKLIFFPIFFYVLYCKVLNINDLYSHVTVLESAMATMITAAVVVTEFNLDTELANLMVGLSIPISLLTVPMFNYIFFK